MHASHKQYIIWLDAEDRHEPNLNWISDKGGVMVERTKKLDVANPMPWQNVFGNIKLLLVSSHFPPKDQIAVLICWVCARIIHLVGQCTLVAREASGIFCLRFWIIAFLKVIIFTRLSSIHSSWFCLFSLDLNKLGWGHAQSSEWDCSRLFTKLSF